ncbi:MAG: hypothetical protein ACKOET_00930 [Verrucomicrobiota bacterium]
MRKAVWLWQGLRVAVEAEDPVLEAVASRFRLLPRAGEGGRPDLQIVFRPVNPAELARLEGEIPELGWTVLPLLGHPVRYSPGHQRLRLGLPGRFLAACHLATGRLDAAYVGSEGDPSWFLSHPPVTLALHEIAKQQGRYMVHAAAVAEGGRGVLLAGASGSGKTTLALALVRAGFGFLGDDLTFLTRGPSGWRALAFPDAVDVTPGTARFFPEIAARAGDPAAWSRPKREVCVGQVFGIEPVWECEPVALVFPRARAGAGTRLAPLGKAEALEELLVNVLRTEAEATQRHLDALAGLVRQVSCYRMETGLDFDLQAARIRALLQSPAGRAG